MRSLFVCGLLVAVSFRGIAYATEQKSLEIDRAVVGAALGRPVIARETTLKEAQAFCAARVPEMPTPADADAWRQMADKMRRDVLDRVVFRGATAWRDAPLRVEWFDTIPGGPGYTIRKLRYEAAPGLWIPPCSICPKGLTARSQ